MLKKIKIFLKENYKFLLILLTIFVVFQVELPYKIYTPGGMVDLTDRVYVESGYSSSGKLGMAYVSMIRGSLPFLALSYILPDWDIVKVEDLTLENESLEERILADKISTQQSIDSAIIASYNLAGKNILVEKEVVHVTYIDPQSQSNLKLFDIVISIDGKKVKNTKELKELVTSYHEGDKLKIEVLRNGNLENCEATIYLVDGVPHIGIAMTVTYEYNEEPSANITMKSSESGPSGGLMMALSLYNSLVEEDITKGKKIIGTGTIDIDGNVGEIGGIRYKLIGAAKKNADLFLVPEANYEEAVNVKNEKGYDIRLVSVSNLTEAIESLKRL